MAIELSQFIRAPIDDVFAFFDDPMKPLVFNAHAVRLEVVDEQPDGRRTFDVALRAGAGEWVQTIEQVVRQPPTRLMTLSGSWTGDRRGRLLTVTTDRRFSPEDDGARVDVTVETRLTHPLRHLLQVIRNWFGRDAARAEFEWQLQAIASRIEGTEAPDRPHQHTPPEALARARLAPRSCELAPSGIRLGPVHHVTELSGHHRTGARPRRAGTEEVR